MAAEKGGVYKCNICGNVVEVVEGHEGDLVCCGQNMELLKAKSKAEEGKEKHVPVVEIEGSKVKVKVGDVPHPMEEKHFIELIEILAEGEVLASYRPGPGEKPEAEFCLEEMPDESKITAREYCNVHGLWKSE